MTLTTDQRNVELMGVSDINRLETGLVFLFSSLIPSTLMAAPLCLCPSVPVEAGGVAVCPEDAGSRVRLPPVPAYVRQPFPALPVAAPGIQRRVLERRWRGEVGSGSACSFWCRSFPVYSSVEDAAQEALEFRGMWSSCSWRSELMV